MAKYSIQAPNGKTYSIEGPSGASQEDVQNEVLRQFPEIAQNGPGGSGGPSPTITPPVNLQTGVVNPGGPAVPTSHSPTLPEQAVRLGGITAKGLVAGALGAPGELVLLGAKGIDWAGRRLWNNTDTAKLFKDSQVPPTSEFLQNLDITGTINKLLPGGVEPANLAERMAKKGAETAGGMVTTGGAGGLKGAELLSKGGAAALARTGMVGAVGSAVGEGVGAINPTAGVVAEVLTNALAGPKAASKIPSAPIRTSEGRFQEAHKLYEAAKNTGTVITPKATNTLVDELRHTIGDRDLLANKPAHAAVDYLAKHSGNGATGWIGIDLGKLMQVRKDMRNEAVGGGITQSKESKRVGHLMMNRFDELIDTMTAKELFTNPLAGRSPTTGKFTPASLNASAEVEALREGMVLKKAADMAYRQGSKAKLLEDTLSKAETLTGGTLAERYRLKIGQLIRNDEKFKQFSAEEQKAIRAYHAGSTPQNIVDFAAKMSPVRGGMIPAYHLAATLSSGGATLPLQAVGGAAHFAAGRMSKAAQEGMMQRVLGAGAPPTQPLQSYLPSEEAVRAGMLSGR